MIKIDSSRKAYVHKGTDIKYDASIGYAEDIKDDTKQLVVDVCTLIKDCNEDLVKTFEKFDRHIGKTFEVYEETEKFIAEHIGANS